MDIERTGDFRLREDKLYERVRINTTYTVDAGQRLANYYESETKWVEVEILNDSDLNDNIISSRDAFENWVKERSKADCEAR